MIMITLYFHFRTLDFPKMEAQLTRLNDTLSGFHGAVQKLEASLEEQAKTLRKLTQINDGSPNEEKKPRITTLHVDEVTENQPRQRDEQVSKSLKAEENQLLLWCRW